ncbi:uncharacterized protein SAPINGB_P004612 [Magnusiomyces paraingens]|uniref:Major facilitator superfamily (MFS) profile domain-containing protein n=1 Tax=Magnusiomyces paraingens TaxID=2606893 RepID=A0A5E8BXW2_9ASCO|nr:uncharacterized protein SAPINGB_P004612 [Saprochaete ingens]VVT55469.1 unnamed protein product [Saprochaete ingens]
MTFENFKSKFRNFQQKIHPYVPHLREIDEQYFIDKFSSKEKTNNREQFTVNQEKNELVYEVRDEANRKWWSLFDEYEYKEHRDKERKVNHKWYHWFDENDSPEERRLIIKLDILLCFFSFVMYWVKYLDQSNLNNAYVSGMKEDLGMKGNDLVNTQVVYTVGSVVFQIPMMYLIHRYPSNILLPSMDIAWGLFTLAIYRSTSVGMLQALRFFVGVFESAFYPTIHYLYGSWYKPAEYTRRGGIYYFGQMLGLLTSGLITASCYENLTGVHGLDGWRWMYIVDAIITLPVAVLGVYMLPGVPKQCYSLFLTDEDIFVARERLRKANIALETEGPQFFSWTLWKDLLWNWKYYAYVILGIWAWNNSNGSSGAYLLWLKSLKEYSVPMINKYSTITPALGIIWIYLTSAIADHARSRWGAIIFSQVFNLVGNIMLAVWYIPKGATWFAFCLQYFGWASSSVIYSWAADAMRHNPQQRAITVVSINMIGQATTAFTSVLVWKTVEAPRYLKGYSFTCTVIVVMMIWTTLMLPFYKKDERKHAHEQGILLYNSAKGETPPSVPQTLSDEEDYVQEHFVIEEEKKI